MVPWPTETQEFLLCACCLGGDQALAARLEWESREGVGRIQGPSYPLLPLLSRQMEGDGLVTGTYRKSWYANQLLLRQHSTLLRRLDSAGIDALHTEGFSLAARYYGDLGARPFPALHLLVRGREAQRARDVLHDLDYEQASWRPPESDPRFFRFQSAASFRSLKGSRLELHWRAIRFGDDEWDNSFWARRQPFSFQGIEGHTLGATDELALVLLRGLSWPTAPGIVWVADALTILQSDHTIDWARMKDLAYQTGSVLPIGLSLHYLRNRFGAPVPETFLDGERATWGDRLLHARLTGKGTGLFGDAGAMWIQNYRTLGRQSLLRSILELPRFLQYQWMLDRRGEVPRFALRRLRQRAEPTAESRVLRESRETSASETARRYKR